MRVAFVTLYDARDVACMSGSGYNIAQAFERAGLDLHYVGPLKRRLDPINVGRYVLNQKILGRNDHPQRDPAFLRHYARQVEAQLRDARVDLVFGSGGLPLSHLRTTLPVVVWTDVTFANLVGYYPKYSNLSARTLRNGHAADQGLYDLVTRGIFSSQWAADSAIRDYGLPADRAVIVPIGANVPEDRTVADVERLVDARPTDRCTMVLIGVDWQRKGGDLAVAAAREMNRRGIPTELQVVGCEPEVAGGVPDFVKPLGRISKRTPEGMRRFVEVLGAAHFLIVPTRAEGFGIVYPEASAFGVPSLGTRTGGTATAVNEGVSGFLFEPDAPGEAYADAAERLMRDRAAYRALALSAFDDFKTRTNWTVVAEQMVAVLRQAVAEGTNRRPGRAP